MCVTCKDITREKQSLERGSKDWAPQLEARAADLLKANVKQDVTNNKQVIFTPMSVLVLFSVELVRRLGDLEISGESMELEFTLLIS